ncbi:MAG: dockerin type I repeat-containing protein [Ruminococcus sp.]|nr:dockerin type I repeat-containing protein [Ruminococcus sp.]
MFADCTSLTTIIVSDKWNSDNIDKTYEAFRNSSKLVGGNGTKNDDSTNYDKIGREYARIDTPKIPGYFTAKVSDKNSGTALNGDANSDGKINVADIAVVASHIKGIKALTGDKFKAADVNNDNNLTVTDIAMIASHIKGIKALS